MRGFFVEGGSARLRRDLPEPNPRSGQVLLRVVRAGICDTDLQLVRGYMGFRGILGHEFVGVDPNGRRVTAEINQACFSCPTCRAGRPGHCPNRTVVGILNHDGAMADCVIVDERTIHPLPDSLDDRTAVFVEPLAAAFRITEQVELGPGSQVAVLGDGKLGILCGWVVRQTGADVTLIGKHPEKLALAGPTITTKLTQDVPDLACRFDLVVEATGSPTGLPMALQLVRPCGTIVLKTTVAAHYEINLAPVVIDEIRVIGSRCGPFPQAITALTEGRFDVRSLIGAEYPLDRVEDAFRTAMQPGARKVLITMD